MKKMFLFFVAKSTPADVNFGVSLLAPVAILLFKAKISQVNIAGILVCLVKLVMLNWKR